LWQRKIIWQPLLWVLLGIILGILLHPHAANLLQHLYAQIFQAGLGANNEVAVGVEWDAYYWRDFLSTNSLVLVAWLAGTADLFWRKFRPSTSTWLWLISLFSLILTIKSRRFIEYSVPFALIFSAAQLSPYLLKVTKENLKAVWHEWEFRVAVLVVLVFIGLGANLGYKNLKLLHSYFSQSASGYLYQGAATWLKNSTQAGDIVFNPQWDQFPQLFYWNPHNYYIIGMDPGFMYLHSPDLYRQWQKVSTDKNEWGSAENLHNILSKEFKAKYVFVESSRSAQLKSFLENNSTSSSLFEQVYSDNKTAVYKIK
jgi:hypothetical protein